MRACHVPANRCLTPVLLENIDPGHVGRTHQRRDLVRFLAGLRSVIFCFAITVNKPDSAPLVAHFFSPFRM